MSYHRQKIYEINIFESDDDNKLISSFNKFADQVRRRYALLPEAILPPSGEFQVHFMANFGSISAIIIDPYGTVSKSEITAMTL